MYVGDKRNFNTESLTNVKSKNTPWDKEQAEVICSLSLSHSQTHADHWLAAMVICKFPVPGPPTDVLS